MKTEVLQLLLDDFVKSFKNLDNIQQQKLDTILNLVKNDKLERDIIRIALLGGPGSGKSTQCARFFSDLKAESKPIEQIQEWVREAINKKQIPEGNSWSQFWIYQEQKIKEDCVPEAIKYLVTDSPTLLSYVYALQYAKRPTDNYLLIKMYENFINDITRYDYVFLCAREKAYLKDGTRSQTKEEAMALDSVIINLLQLHSIPYNVLTGSADERSKKMREIIKV